MKKQMKIGLLGYGVVGKGVVDIVDAHCPDLEVKYVLVRRPREELGDKAVTDFNVMLNDPEVDIIVEAMGGLSPAYEYVHAALEAGKNVVSSNKQLISYYYDELANLAMEKKVALRCTAAVGGGIPWLTAIERGRRGNRIIGISGIMNGTTNYILDAMYTNGSDFDAVLKKAQELGYAEADPSSDIDGLDIQRKCVISSNVAFGVSIPEEQVPVFGIRNIKACDIDAAKRLGKICKMMAIARQTKDNKITAYVEPVFLPGESLEASVHDAFNLITLEGEYSGVQSFFGQGAGRYPTAYNVVEDCADLLHGIDDFYTDVIEPKSVDNAEELHPYYIRGLRSPETVKALKVINCGEGIISKPISVVEAHTIAESQAGEELFMAGILED